VLQHFCFSHLSMLFSDLFLLASAFMYKVFQTTIKYLLFRLLLLLLLLLIIREVCVWHYQPEPWKITVLCFSFYSFRTFSRYFPLFPVRNSFILHNYSNNCHFLPINFTNYLRSIGYYWHESWKTPAICFNLSAFLTLPCYFLHCSCLDQP
jgi:hypothetical protein